VKSKQSIFAGHVTPPGVRRSGSNGIEFGPVDPQLGASSLIPDESPRIQTQEKDGSGRA